VIPNPFAAPPGHGFGAFAIALAGLLEAIAMAEVLAANNLALHPRRSRARRSAPRAAWADGPARS
jgi:hypothetical protein